MFTKILEQYRIDYLGKGNMTSSADQAYERLLRVLNNLYENYGVRIENDVFVGLTPKVLLQWNRQMTLDGKTMATKNAYIVTLNPFLKWLIINEYLVQERSDNHLSDIPIYSVLKAGKLPKENSIPIEERKTKSFTCDQIKSLMGCMSGRNAIRNRAILALFIYSGIRESELCSLTLASILSQPHGLMYLKRKGGLWQHTPIADAFYPYLDEYLSERENTSDLTAPLFLSENGGFLTRVAVWKLISKAEKAAGLVSGVHILRHTVISNIDKNYSAGAARDIANHSSLVITNRYDHTTQEERLEAINSLDW